MKKKKILILGRTNEAINSKIVQKAKEMGIYTIVVCYAPDLCLEKDYADEYWVQDLRNVDSLIKKCQAEGIDGIYGGGDTMGTVALNIAKALNLPYYCDEDTWQYARNKKLFKEKCVQHGVPTAKVYSVSESAISENLLNVEYPVIVKPIDESGNHGFSYCYNAEELKYAIQKAKVASRSGQYLVEHLLRGLEYGAFYVCTNGEYRLLNFWSMLHQPGTASNIYELNVSVTDKLQYYLENIDSKIRSLMKDIGCRDGVVWFEFMADEDGKLYALEMGQRLSGEMMYLPLNNVTGFDVLEHMVHYAVYGSNEVSKLPENQITYWNKGACGYILWSKSDKLIKQEVGENEVSSIPGVSINHKYKVGQKMTLFGYGVIMSIIFKDVEDLIDKIKTINQNYHLLDENGEDMIIYYDDFDYLRKLDKIRD